MFKHERANKNNKEMGEFCWNLIRKGVKARYKSKGFNQRRKKMSNSLAAFRRSHDPVIRERHDLDRRPERLSVAEFAALADDLVE